MSMPIVTNHFDEINHFNKFVEIVKRYASGMNADYRIETSESLFSATVYSLHKTKLSMRPNTNSISATVYYGNRNVKTYIIPLK